jgi:hypothetical protein
MPRVTEYRAGGSQTVVVADESGKEQAFGPQAPWLIATTLLSIFLSLFMGAFAELLPSPVLEVLKVVGYIYGALLVLGFVVAATGMVWDHFDRW